MASRSFLKIHDFKAALSIFGRNYSQSIVHAKLSEIRSKIKQKEYDATFHIEKELILQRYNLNPSKAFLEKHPILLQKRSLSDIKNLLYLLNKRCGFDNESLLKIYQRHPSLIELHPNDIIQCLNTFKTLGFNHYECFLRLEPSILLQSITGNHSFLDRLKLYKEILNEIGVENECELLEKHCVHIIQRDPKYVLGTLKYYESFGLDLNALISKHPQCMIYTLSHIKKVIHFIHEYMSDAQGIDIKIIQICPQILGINLDKLKTVIAWLNAVDLFKLSHILEQCPDLLSCNDAERMDESYKCLINDYGVSKSMIRNNLWLLLLRKNTIERRIKVMQEYDTSLKSDNVELLKQDHNHIHRYFKQKNRVQT